MPRRRRLSTAGGCEFEGQFTPSDVQIAAVPLTPKAHTISHQQDQRARNPASARVVSSNSAEGSPSRRSRGSDTPLSAGVASSDYAEGSHQKGRPPVRYNRQNSTHAPATQASQLGRRAAAQSSKNIGTIGRVRLFQPDQRSSYLTSSQSGQCRRRKRFSTAGTCELRTRLPLRACTPR